MPLNLNTLSLGLLAIFAFGLFSNQASAAGTLSVIDKASPAQKQKLEQQKHELEAQRTVLDQRRTALELAVTEMQKASAKMARLSHEMNLGSDFSVQVIRLESEASVMSTQSAFIGVVINQDGEGNGVEIIGLTPDGPADKAGLLKGDQVLSINGTDLLLSPSFKRIDILQQNLRQAQIGDSVDLTVLRDDKAINLRIIAGKRNPLGLHTLIRPGQPPQPPMPHALSQTLSTTGITLPDSDKLVLIQRALTDAGGLMDSKQIIVQVEGRDGMVSGLAGGEMERHIKLLEKRLENMEIDIETVDFRGSPDMSNFEVIIGQAAENAIFFFDRNMVRGLELAPLNPGLGNYFQVDSGVLVLSAREDNSLNLAAGDVITAVGSQEVSRPADLMRNLRFLKDGEKISLEVIRKGQSETIESQAVDKSIQRISSPQMH